MAGRIATLYNFPFSLIGIFISQRTHVAALHFNQADLIRWDTSSSILPDLWIIDPRYLNESFGDKILYPIKISTSLLWAISMPLKSHLRYSVFSQLTLRPLSFRASLQFSSMLFKPSTDSKTRTISSVKIMHHEMYSCIPLDSSSRIKTKSLFDLSNVDYSIFIVIDPVTDLEAKLEQFKIEQAAMNSEAAKQRALLQATIEENKVETDRVKS
ncbi:hypothetical protein Tco_1173588 [Tanacetum coccineum]